MSVREEIVAALAEQRQRIETWYRRLSAEELTRPVTTSEVEGGEMWAAKDHLAHLLGTERFFQGALKRMAAGAEDPLGFYTAIGSDDRAATRKLINESNERSAAKYRGEPAEAIFGRFDETRAATLALLASFDDNHLQQQVPHSHFGDGTVAALFQTIAGHGHMHMDWLANAHHAPQVS